LSAIQVHLHFVLLEELPASAEFDVEARLTVLRESQPDEPFFGDLLQDPEQGT
jgi:hypothetical protein